MVVATDFLSESVVQGTAVLRCHHSDGLFFLNDINKPYLVWTTRLSNWIVETNTFAWKKS